MNRDQSVHIITVHWWRVSSVGWCIWFNSVEFRYLQAAYRPRMNVDGSPCTSIRNSTSITRAPISANRFSCSSWWISVAAHTHKRWSKLLPMEIQLWWCLVGVTGHLCLLSTILVPTCMGSPLPIFWGQRIWRALRLPTLPSSTPMSLFRLPRQFLWSKSVGARASKQQTVWRKLRLLCYIHVKIQIVWLEQCQIKCGRKHFRFYIKENTCFNLYSGKSPYIIVNI